MIIVANWKAYVEHFEHAQKLFAVSKKLIRDSSCTIVLAPPTPFLGALALTNKTDIAFSAQDVSASVGGSETGEVTAPMIATVGATYVIVGHSERRARGDTNAQIAEKIERVLSHSLTPILCVGERERDSEGRYLAYIREELTTALAPLDPKERSKVIVAYEPLWAIGKTAEHAVQRDDLFEMILYLRKVLGDFLPAKTASRARILYGGAVEADNIRDLSTSGGVDGFLVGHASSQVESFALLVKNLS